MAKTFKETLVIVRTAVLGKEVREGLAQMAEYCATYAEQAKEAADSTGGLDSRITDLETSAGKVDTLETRVAALETENKGALSDTAKSLMLSLFEQAAYGNASMQPTLDVLRAEFNSSSGGGTTKPTSYSVVYSLSHVTSSTSVTSVSAGGSFTATLSPASGYTMSSVTVRMGGNDVTASAYNSSTRKISISSVTGTLIITASAASSSSGGSGTVPVTSVALSKTSLSLTVGTSAALTATVSPSNATDKTVTWTVTPSGYATVSGGVVKAVKAGSCTVTATAGGKSARCSVTVAAAAAAENTNPFPSLTPSYLLASPKTFVPANKNYIDTGVKLFSSIDPKPSFTILFEAQGGEGLSAVANTYVAMHCMEESKPWPGMALQALSSGAMQLPCYSSKPELGTVAEWKADKHRMAIRMDAGNLSGWRPTSGKADWGAVDGLTTAVDKTLLIGCYQESDGTKGRFWDGTFYQIVVYPSALTDAQITGWVNGTTTTEDTVSLSESQLLLRVGDTYTLTAEASGDVTWSASPSGVVSVADGVLTVQGEGSCIVTATVGKASAQCTVSAVASTGTLLRKLPEAKTFASAKGDRVTTGLKLFESIDPKPSCTILCDFQLDAGADLTKAPILYDCATEDSSVHGLSLSMWNGGRLGVTLYGFSNSINVSSSVSERHKFALQLKEGQKKVWLDGTATWGGFADISGYTTTADAELLLGCDQGHNRLLDGTIYRFEVHNSILSEDEITTWMNAEG